MSESTFIHPSADVQCGDIGAGTRIWQFCVVLPGARIGAGCNICAGCFIEGGAEVGDRVTLKNGVYLWSGITLEDEVFVGPNVTFTNDEFPRSGQHRAQWSRTRVCRGASIGAGAVLLPGITVGEGAMVGAGEIGRAHV